MRFIIDESSYSYDLTGEGPAVLLLHGFTGSKRTWDSLKDFLLPDYQVIRLDLPGHGKTNSAATSMEKCAKHIVEFLRYIKVEQAHLIGYSMGGRLALSFANLYPERVRSLTLESSSPGLKTRLEREERIKQDELLAKKLIEEGLEKFVQFWENIPLFETQKGLPDHVQERVRSERLSQQANQLADSLSYMGTGSQASYWGSLDQLRMPVQLIVGGLDEKFVQINQAMAKKIRGVRLEIIEDSGHAPHIEAENSFQELVKNFLNHIEEEI